jgi:DNA-binding transcriptional LysR family regulator
MVADGIDGGNHSLGAGFFLFSARSLDMGGVRASQATECAQAVADSHPRRDPDSESWLTGYFARQGLSAPEISVRTSSFATGLDLVRRGGFIMVAPVQLARLVAASDMRAVCTDPPTTRLPTGSIESRRRR